MYDAHASEIPLAAWQDPQGDVLLVYSEAECSIYFGCWTNAGQPADYVCRLRFKGAKGVRSYPREFVPYDYTSRHHSSILEVEASPWRAEQIEKHWRLSETVYTSHPPLPFEVRHFVVKGHDIYHEILAAEFEESRIERKDINEPRLLALIDAA